MTPFESGSLMRKNILAAFVLASFVALSPGATAADRPGPFDAKARVHTD